MVTSFRQPRKRRQGARRKRDVNVVAIADASGEGPRAMLAGLNAVVAARGWVLHLLTTTEGVSAEISEIRPDLVVLVANPHVPVREMQRSAIVVSAGDDLSAEGVPSIDIDDDAVGVMAARHFLDRGLTAFAAYGFWHLKWAVARAGAFRRLVTSAGYSCDVPGWAENAKPIVGRRAFGGRDIVSVWLRELAKPVGLFAGCDEWGRHLSNYCRLAGVRVPEDVAILGVDNDAGLCELASPPLSSIAIPWRRVGFEAGLLGERLMTDRKSASRRPAECMRIPPTDVFVRRSSDTLAVSDPDVAAALAVIHEYADRPLSVAQILRRVPATQHRLERAFKRLVGRRMTQEIRRVHVERARRLLSTTDLPMPAVARASGFTSASKLSVAFRTETGQTPRDYRRNTWIKA